MTALLQKAALPRLKNMGRDPHPLFQHPVCVPSELRESDFVMNFTGCQMQEDGVWISQPADW